jgi:phosphonate degradation associated HDIG domain protein
MSIGLADIGKLFRDHGHVAYSGEAVSQLEHALQSAQLAERAGAADELVTAAFLHDLGHLLNLQGETPSARGIDDQHQYFAIPFIRALFKPAVVEAIRLHVDAKRALCALEPDYYEALSEDSKRSLTLQGGIFTRAETEAFLARPFAAQAMQVRRWDDAAKVAGEPTPPIGHYLEIAARCTAAPAPGKP